MSATILWLWDDTNKVYVKAQCDENGYLKIDMSEISLNDLADVNVPAPANDNFLRFDAGTSKWVDEPAPVLTRLASKVKYETRDMAVASGDVAYAGYGFQPTALIVFAVQYLGEGRSWGMADSALSEEATYRQSSETDFRAFHYLLRILEDGSSLHYVTAYLTSYDADGFTLTWVKVGNPIAIIRFMVLALR